MGAAAGRRPLIVATPGEAITLGAYDVTPVESEHCPPDRFPGEITEPVVPPVNVGVPMRRGVVDAGASSRPRIAGC